MFLAYVDEANALVHAPRFYHTITGNCTTLVYQMMKRIVGHLPFDYRVLLSGYMPEYVYSVGGLDRNFPLEELRALGYISERARKADSSETFSADIRRGSAAPLRRDAARFGPPTALAAPARQPQKRVFRGTPHRSPRCADRD